jgi:hypothetical protein
MLITYSLHSLLANIKCVDYYIRQELGYPKQKKQHQGLNHNLNGSSLLRNRSTVAPMPRHIEANSTAMYLNKKKNNYPKSYAC